MKSFSKENSYILKDPKNTMLPGYYFVILLKECTLLKIYFDIGFIIPNDMGTIKQNYGDSKTTYFEGNIALSLNCLLATKFSA